MRSIFVMTALAFGSAQAQVLHATGPLPAFEVVSIREWHRPVQPPPIADGQPGVPKKVMKVDPGSGVVRSVTSTRVHGIFPTQVLIAQAYHLPMDSGRIVGGPAWLHEDLQYDIDAKIDEATFATMKGMTAAEQRDQVRLMQQSLLADRFGLKVHFEMREMPMFALEAAKGEAKLTASADGEANKLLNFEDAQGSGLKGTAVTLDQLTQSPLLLGGRVVVNQTGLTGKYDFTLRYAGESGDGDQPGLYTALEEQLGLKLKATKGMVEVLVIDAIERPSEN